MTKITKIYTQHLPKMKFIGKCYSEKDKVNNTFSKIWEDWFINDWFTPIELKDSSPELFEDSHAYYGLCRCQANEEYQYWIGVFVPESTIVPEGYESIVLDEGEIAVCLVYGKEPDIYFVNCLKNLEEKGYSWGADKNNTYWMFERYVCSRFTEPDRDGNVILDKCYYI